jgi:hypothetical protein
MQANLTILDDVVRSVVGGATHLEVVMSDDGVAAGSPRYSAEIPLQGAWSGRLRLEVSPALAHELAGAMLHRRSGEVDKATAMDAIGELANMIAGNLRPLIDGARSLGTPLVEHRVQSTLHGLPVLGRAFGSPAGHMEVELFADRPTDPRLN